MTNKKTTKRKPKPKTITLDMATCEKLAKILRKADKQVNTNASRLKLGSEGDALDFLAARMAAIALETLAWELEDKVSAAKFGARMTGATAPATLTLDERDLVAALAFVNRGELW